MYLRVAATHVRARAARRRTLPRLRLRMSTGHTHSHTHTLTCPAASCAHHAVSAAHQHVVHTSVDRPLAAVAIIGDTACNLLTIARFAFVPDKRNKSNGQFSEFVRLQHILHDYCHIVSSIQQSSRARLHRRRPLSLSELDCVTVSVPVRVLQLQVRVRALTAVEAWRCAVVRQAPAPTEPLTASTQCAVISLSSSRNLSTNTTLTNGVVAARVRSAWLLATACAISRRCNARLLQYRPVLCVPVRSHVYVARTGCSTSSLTCLSASGALPTWAPT
jgi:hypothetical protein